MRLTLCVAAAVAASVVSGGSEARAQAVAFGKAGELAISWDQPLVAGSLATVNPGDTTVLPAPMTLTPLGFQYYSVNNNNGSGSVFVIAPAADYFVVDNLSLGGQVMFGVASASDPQGPGRTTTLFGIGPQIGYNIPFSGSISFWPKLFFAFASSSENNNGPSVNSGTLGVFAPFLFHIATHFYAGIGPDFSTQLFVNESNRGGGGGGPPPPPPKTTTFGAMGTFGGWFSLGGG
jgi:hypothetical protein